MQEIFIKLLIIAYGSTAIVDTMAYWPTIVDLWKHRRPSANVHSYFLWTITTGVSFLYSLFVLPDLLFRLVSGMVFFSNVLILILSIRLRKNPKK